LEQKPMKMFSAAALAGSLMALAAGAGAVAQPASAVLSAAQVNAQIVGHKVTSADPDGGMTWYYMAGGKYDADDGRNSRGGTYRVQPDGRLCWTETSGIKGCFQYYRKAGKMNVRRADPDNKFEVGEVTVGPLD